MWHGTTLSDVGLQLIENKALSWGIIRRSAYILAEITIRKSQTPSLRGFLVVQSSPEKRPIPETSLFKIGACNYRSQNQLYGQSRKLVSFIKVSLVHD